MKNLISLSLAIPLSMTAAFMGTDHTNINKNYGVTNGKTVKPGTVPWFCSIAPQQNPTDIGNLGGVLINQNWVLSCAHDIDDIVSWQGNAILWFNNYNTKLLNYNHVVYRISSKIIIDPLYAQHGYFNYDLSLIKLNKPINNIPSVTLPKKNVNIGDNVTVYGFGISGETKQGKAIWPTHLQEGNIKVDNPKANKPYQAYDHFNPKNEILAGALTGKRTGAALNDSGGPLIKFINNTPVLEGIVSRGVTPYSSGWIRAYPSIYSDVYANLKWIENTINNN